MAIKVYNRVTGRIEDELVYGEKTIRLLYENRFFKPLAPLLAKKSFSRMFGLLQARKASLKKIPAFIEKFQIKMDEYEAGPFRSFNEFFIRKFKPSSRTFAQDEKALAAFAEGRYAAYESLSPNQSVKIKGTNLSISSILMRQKWGAIFDGGPVMIARLCPLDYHRFHFPDHGKVIETYPCHGPLHSVNPVALTHNEKILFTNERVVTILETENFGKLAYIEVGAICVGKIVNTHLGSSFQKGDEKGYFLFGGSTVVLIGEKGRFTPSPDLIKNTQEGVETLVLLGGEIARCS